MSPSITPFSFARPIGYFRSNGFRFLPSSATIQVASAHVVHRSQSSLSSPGSTGQKAYEFSLFSQDSLKPSLATLLAHAGVDTSMSNAPMSPPLSMATTYTRPPDGPYHEGDWQYSRMDNPTRSLLEETVGRLECHGSDKRYEHEDDLVTTCAFSSGLAAVSSLVMSHTAPVTVLLPTDNYHGVTSVFADVMTRFNVTYKHVDYSRVSDVEEALTQVNKSSNILVWMESPSNPLCQVIDMEAVCAAVEKFRSETTITTVADSTLAPPCITQPLNLGVDAVLHSGTKYLGGHSDVLLGIVTVSPWTLRGKELGPLLRDVQVEMGAVASPFDSWLTLRGLRTLHVRVRRQCETALRLATYLNSHDFVTSVRYPGLASHPQHDIATRQMNMGYGGILSFELQDEASAMAVAGALKLAQRATSLGGTETLVEHRASIEPEGRVTSPDGLLRVSVGLEDADDLIHDFDRALSIADLVNIQ